MICPTPLRSLNMQKKQSVKQQENTVPPKANIWWWKQEPGRTPILHENHRLYRLQDWPECQLCNIIIWQETKFYIQMGVVCRNDTEKQGFFTATLCKKLPLCTEAVSMKCQYISVCQPVMSSMAQMQHLLPQKKTGSESMSGIIILRELADSMKHTICDTALRTMPIGQIIMCQTKE
jgi:hypothetical protein